MIIDLTVLGKEFGVIKCIGKQTVAAVQLSFRPSLPSQRKEKRKVSEEKGTNKKWMGTGAVTKRADFIHLANMFHVLVQKLRGTTRI